MTDYTEIMINAIFTGIGTGVGSYLANKYAISHIQKIETTMQEQAKKIRELQQDIHHDEEEV